MRNRRQNGGRTSDDGTPSSRNNNQFQVEEENRKSLANIRFYVILSIIGAVTWLIIITVWVVIFQLNRVKWGEWGDSISFNIPRGMP